MVANEEKQSNITCCCGVRGGGVVVVVVVYSAELGREEIAAIEVYVLTQSNYFAGAHASSMSHLV